MTNFDIGQLAQAAQSALDAQTKGQEFMLSDVCNQTRAAYERYPEDPVIKQVAYTMERMADRASPGTTISQAEISNIYNNFVRPQSDSKFRAVLGHLLHNDRVEFQTRNTDYTRLNRIDAEDSHISTEDMVDKSMVNALQAAFDGSMDFVKAFDEQKAAKGKKYVELELQALGINKPDVDIMGGNQHTLVYAAHIDTRNGRVSVAIPIELTDGKLLLPSTFVADDRLQELTASNLHYFVDKKGQAKDFSTPNVNDVLTAVGIISGRNTTTADNDFAELGKLFGEEGDIQLTTPSLYVDRQYEQGRPDIDTTPNVEMPKELAHLARDFEDDLLEAVSAFGKPAIDSGKRMVLSELKAAGFKNAQVRFGSEGSESVVYLATINTPKGPVDIEVPVDMVSTANNDSFVPLYPKYFAYDGLVEDFIPAKLQRFAVNLPAPSTGSVSFRSGLSYMTLPELKDEILKGVSDGDYVTCEAALEEIQAKYSEEDYKNAIADFHYMNMQKSNLEKRASAVVHTCSKQIPAGKGSVYARCGHFGVPMHKVVADEQGNCRLKTAVEREKMNPKEEGGASISSAKVFMS